MRLIPASSFQTQPWKNGGGVTHEIAREDREGQIRWRLSIAEVASDGPFSAFPGLSRILTVIEGAGLHLHTPDGRLDALPFTPLGFSGDLAVTCRRVGGDVRDFNVIYDPQRISAAVQVFTGDEARTCPAAAGQNYAAPAFGAGTTLDGTPVPDGAAVLFEHGTLKPGAAAPAILVTLQQI